MSVSKFIVFFSTKISHIFVAINLIFGSLVIYLSTSFKVKVIVNHVVGVNVIIVTQSLLLSHHFIVIVIANVIVAVILFPFSFESCFILEQVRNLAILHRLRCPLSS